ncbi:hypothetical protein [Halomicrobium urmianum]|uniref:hypothetical protein n=1 Tax=Halomicrobium urmianum TaxID=1586233 RepID=UPI001CDA4DD3|nr:hypothetical protein [Halomicrobium urmianum]
MDRLSSCYFCGAALDASLSEYPIVPAELHPDDDQQQTVVLCPTCRRKLGQVVETVVGAMDGRSGTDGDSERRQVDADGAVEGDADGGDVGWMSAEDAVEQGSTSSRSASPRGDAAGDEGLLGGASGDDGSATPRRRRNGSAGAGDGNSDAPTGRPNGGRSGSTGDGGNYADGRSAADVANDRSEAGDAVEQGSTSPGSQARQDADEQSSSSHRSASPHEDAAGASSSEPSVADTPEDADEQSSSSPRSASPHEDADEGTGGPTDGEPSLTRLEYNKVMRLLQNREFPVDRAEIRAVATNAYKISDDEFERIIDAAVEHDLIDERNGQLVQAD